MKYFFFNHFDDTKFSVSDYFLSTNLNDDKINITFNLKSRHEWNFVQSMIRNQNHWSLVCHKSSIDFFNKKNYSLTACNYMAKFTKVSSIKYDENIEVTISGYYF